MTEAVEGVGLDSTQQLKKFGKAHSQNRRSPHSLNKGIRLASQLIEVMRDQGAEDIRHKCLVTASESDFPHLRWSYASELHLGGPLSERNTLTVILARLEHGGKCAGFLLVIRRHRRQG